MTRDGAEMMAVRLLQYSDVENAYDRPERIGRLAGLIGELRGENTLVVGTGDNTGPGVLSLVTEGRQALEFFRRIDPDLETFGNHDFDHGPGAIRRIVADAPQTWVAANVYRPGASPPERDDDGDGRTSAEGSDDGLSGTEGSDDGLFGAEAGVVPTAIREVGGTRLGFFGVLDPATPEVTPTAADLVVTDPVETATRATAALRDRGAESVIALSHAGREDDEIARRTDVDVVLGGHVHTRRLDRVGGTLLTRPGANAGRLFELRLEEDRWTAVAHDVTEAPIDAAVAGALRERLAAADLNTPVATAETPIDRDDGTAFAGPCRIGNVVAESYRWATGADVGLQNSGGIRAGAPLSGTVTAADLVSVVPFGEPVATVGLSGRDLRAVLAERDGNTVDGAPDDRWMGHATGVVRRDGTLHVGGDPIDPGRTYALATSAYLCYAADEFPTLTGREPVERTDRTQYEVLVDYARERGLDGGGGETYGTSSVPR
jgi:2',3'-cyclic-nucleotide 2'-phosphodiesterase (5'-nucleotidase family)